MLFQAPLASDDRPIGGHTLYFSTEIVVPLRAVFKIVRDRVRPLLAIGHFIEG